MGARTENGENPRFFFWKNGGNHAQRRNTALHEVIFFLDGDAAVLRTCRRALRAQKKRHLQKDCALKTQEGSLCLVSRAAAARFSSHRAFFFGVFFAGRWAF